MATEKVVLGKIVLDDVFQLLQCADQGLEATRPPDWEDFVGIVLPLLINSAIGCYERNAGNAVKAPTDSLAPSASAPRSSRPDPCPPTEAISNSIDQAALTGEAPPQSKKLGNQRFSNYAIYACGVTIRIFTCFSILAFAYKFDAPPLMELIIALLNDSTIMPLSVDRATVLPLWDLVKVFAHAVVYDIYLTPVMTAAYADWGFTKISAISGGWIGIVWVWNAIWFFPLDLIKFAINAVGNAYINILQAD
ncbi:hypothetical protein HWV62_28284 [Athelia sp. TMB]|nr:hypothetical protein HWV62_28284 [Athelia sp. TMB]